MRETIQVVIATALAVLDYFAHLNDQAHPSPPKLNYYLRQNNRARRSQPKPSPGSRPAAAQDTNPQDHEGAISCH
jgi:hypothetical protein